VRAALIGLLLLGALAVPAAGSTRATDPPRIVPWHLIGNIGLGMSRSRVERLYGPGSVVLSPPRDALVWRYRGRGAIDVEYDLNNDVAAVETASPAYATRSGIRIGAHLPPKLCDFVDFTCKHVWRGFSYESDYASWTRVSTLSRYERAYVEIELGARSVVHHLMLTRFLDCPRGRYEIRNACRKPPPGQNFRFYFPPPAGQRFCSLPGGPGNFLSASPSVPCAVASSVIDNLSTAACGGRAGCQAAAGFQCVSYWSGHYVPLGYSHHAICTDRRYRRVVWDGG
jgi:hypothetical protein